MEGLKTCSHCRIDKPINCFNRNKNTRDGLSSQCKDCRHIYELSHIEQKRAYRRANMEKIKEYQAEYNQRYKSEHREYLRLMERLRRQKLKTKAAWAAVKTYPQQRKPVDDSVQMRLYETE